MHWCRRCNTRVSSSLHNTDVVHECNSGDAALDNEDVFVVGTWQDYTGSGTVNSQVMRTAGTVNDLMGSVAGLEGGRSNDTLTDRGKRKDLYRTRKHLEYIDLR